MMSAVSLTLSEGLQVKAAGKVKNNLCSRERRLLVRSHPEGLVYGLLSIDRGPDVHATGLQGLRAHLFESV